jgi:dipeptidyl aminopeptidase/acylaminoacyl peptidase
MQQFPGWDGSTQLFGKLYFPKPREDASARNVTKSSSPPPIVVMAHGLGLVQDASLDPFIRAFQDEGYAVMTFDYATFGYSEGLPRHQVIPSRHVEDLRSAIDHVRKNLYGTVDTDRIALWGTSLGGGHVLKVSADDSKVRAVVANVPHVKSAFESILGTILRDPYHASLGLLKISGALLKWIVTKFLNALSISSDTTTYIPLHGLPGSSAMMQNPGDDAGYGSLVKNLPATLRWNNLASVSSVVPVLLYRPFNTVHQITSPTLFISAEEDTLCPAADSFAAVKKMNPDKARLHVMKGLGHFDIYSGEALQVVLNETIRFLREHL